jgi:hypothetical protein
VKKYLKLAVSLCASLCASLSVYGAPPAPPVFNGVAGMPNTGAWVTNVTWIYTNVAVVGPTMSLPKVTIYNGTNGLTGCTVLAWNPSPTPNLAKYNLYYAATNTTTTNVYATLPDVVCVAFFGVFNTNLYYWSWVVAVDKTNNMSVPSNAILFKGQ